jgi:hypothetical protein
MRRLFPLHSLVDPRPPLHAFALTCMRALHSSTRARAGGGANQGRVGAGGGSTHPVISAAKSGAPSPEPRLRLPLRFTLPPAHALSDPFHRADNASNAEHRHKRSAHSYGCADNVPCAYHVAPPSTMDAHASHSKSPESVDQSGGVSQ